MNSYIQKTVIASVVFTMAFASSQINSYSHNSMRNRVRIGMEEGGKEGGVCLGDGGAFFGQFLGGVGILSAGIVLGRNVGGGVGEVVGGFFGGILAIEGSQYAKGIGNGLGVIVGKTIGALGGAIIGLTADNATTIRNRTEKFINRLAWGFAVGSTVSTVMFLNKYCSIFR